MVVDDEKNIRRMLRLVLEGEGYRVREAGDALELYAELKKATVDLIILDVHNAHLAQALQQFASHLW